MGRVSIVLVGILLAGCSKESIRESSYSHANKYFERGKYREAALLYRRALQVDPGYAPAWHRLGLTRLRMGDVRGAATALRRTMELDAGNDDACVRLAEIYALAALAEVKEADRKQVIASASPLVERIQKKNGRSYDALRLSGYLALARQDRKTAVENLRAANELKPGQPEVTVALAENLALDGQTEEAGRLGEAFLEQHKDNFPMHNFLYSLYVRTGQMERAEEILKKRIRNLPDDGRSRLQLALHYYVTKRNQEMAGLLRRMPDELKNQPGVYGLIGDFYARIGDLNSAMQAYREGARQNPKENTAYEEKVIEALIAQGNSAEAMAAADRLAGSDPKDAESAAFRALVRAVINPGEIQTSIAKLEGLAATRPQDAPIHLYLGRLYGEKADPDSLRKARTHLEAALSSRAGWIPAKALLAQVDALLEDGAGALRAADDVLRQEPDNPDARIGRAMAFRVMQMPDKARDDLMSGLRMNIAPVRMRLQLGELDLAEKRYREAEKEFDLAARAGDPRGVVGLAQVMTDQGQAGKAIATLRSQCGKLPAAYECVFALASLELREGYLAEAKTGFEGLIQARPQFAEPYLRLATVQMKLGDSAGALDNFRKVRQLSPSNVQAALAVAVLLDALGKKAEAAAAYQEVLRLDSRNAQALNNLAYMKAEQGVDLNRALGWAQDAVRNSPDNASYRDTLGLVYFKHGLIEQSIEVLEPLVKKNPNDASMHLHLAMALYAASMKQKAGVELKLAMAHGPSEGEKAQIRELAGKLGVR